VDPPHTFELSQQAGVNSGGVLRLNPTVQDIRQSVLHEAGHVLWARANIAERAQLRALVSDNLAFLRESSPGYAKQFEAGDVEEAVAHIFAKIHDLPEQTRSALLQFQPTGKSFDDAFPQIDHIEAPRTDITARNVRSWDEIRRDSFGYLTDQDDLAAIASTHGDRMIVIKDVNGGRSVLPASQAARLLDDPVGSGFVREVFLAAEDIPLGAAIPQGQINFLPEFKKAVDRATAELPQPQQRPRLSAAPASTPSAARAAGLGTRRPSRQVSQVFEDAFNPEFGYQFTPQQKSLIQDMHRSVAEAAQLMTENGIKITEVVLEGEGSSYFPRLVKEIRGVTRDAAGQNNARTLGKKPTSLKRRSYVGQAIEEGVAKGIVYENDPIAILEAFQSAAYRAVRDKQLADALQPLATRTVKGSIKGIAAAADISQKSAVRLRSASDLVGRAIRGERISEQALTRMDGVAPEAARTIRSLQESAGDARNSLREALANIPARKRQAPRARTIARRALRGEKVPEATLEAIRENHPELVSSIRAMRSTGNAQRDALKELRTALREQARTARREAKQLATQRASARESAALPRAGEAKITTAKGFDQPLFSGQFFDEDTAARITKQLGLAEKSQFQRAAETTGSVGDVMRVTRTGLDFGAPLLQGLPLLATNPVKWSRGVKHQFVAFAQPLHHQRYLSENLQVIDEMVAHGVPLSGAATDYFDALRRGAPLDKFLARLGPPGRAVGGTFHRFQRSFDSFGDFARIEQWKALRETAALKGQAGLDDLAVYLRNSTGALSPAALGVNPSQQAIERGFLFFSPRYTRACLALVANSFQGGMRGELARKAFRNMAMGGLGTYMMVSAALGQEPKLDPTKGDFMTVQIGKDRVGVGSF
ncbi:MAG: hypothetical protein O2968_23945, partial [Acidobacteria bacterium]|nr:hypothetical protein [Acidobacteriota bacterium]